MARRADRRARGAGGAGASVALATWALAWLAAAVLLALPALSGGAQGLTRPAVDTRRDAARFDAHADAARALVVAAASCSSPRSSITARIRRGPVGRGRRSRSARTARWRAELGVPIAQRIVTLLALAARVGAAGGAGFALLIGVAAPADLSPLLALQLFAAVIVGGGAPIAGPLLALAVIAGIPRAADLLSETGLSSGAANGVMTAAALVACLWLRPHVAARIRRKPPNRVPPGSGPQPTSTNFAAATSPTDSAS